MARVSSQQGPRARSRDWIFRTARVAADLPMTKSVGTRGATTATPTGAAANRLRREDAHCGTDDGAAATSAACATEIQLPPDATAVLVRERLGLKGGGEDTLRSRRLLSPLAVHFSQSLIRPEFQDGRPVEESALAITSDLCSPISADDATDLQLMGAPPAAPPGDRGEDNRSRGSSWRLQQSPFEEIEVIQWRCKLREADGSVKVDETGAELYGDRAWYSLDNRRLYCLQRAAVAHWPVEVRCVVSIVRQEDGSYREFRKFRTLDLGRTVRIGHRDDKSLPMWSWRREVGLAPEPLPAGSALPSRSLHRSSGSFRRQGPNSGRSNCSSGRSGDERAVGRYAEEKDPWEVAKNVALFVLLYASLRVVFSVGWQIYSGALPLGT